MTGLLFTLLALAQDHVEEGNRAFREERYEAAVRHYRKALEKTDSDAVRMNLGHALFRLQRWIEAIEAYGKVAGGKGMVWIARCHLARGRPREAEHVLLGWLSLHPRDEKAAELLAGVYAGMGKHGAAAELYRGILEDRPADARIYDALGRQELARGRRGEAIDAFEAAWRLGRREAEVARALGDLYLAEGMFREAAGYYEKFLAAAKDPGAEDYFRVGYAYYMGGELVSANACFRRAAEADAGYAKALLYLGRIHARRDRPDRARESFTEALRRNPRLVEARIALGDLLFEERRYAAAAREYTEAVRDGATDLAVHHNRVVALLRAGKEEEAIQALKDALHEHPLNRRLRGLLKRFGGREEEK